MYRHLKVVLMIGFAAVLGIGAGAAALQQYQSYASEAESTEADNATRQTRSTVIIGDKHVNVVESGEFQVAVNYDFTTDGMRTMAMYRHGSIGQLDNLFPNDGRRGHQEVTFKTFDLGYGNPDLTLEEVALVVQERGYELATAREALWFGYKCSPPWTGSVAALGSIGSDDVGEPTTMVVSIFQKERHLRLVPPTRDYTTWKVLGVRH
jgi:hypothetical protein